MFTEWLNIGSSRNRHVCVCWVQDVYPVSILWKNTNKMFLLLGVFIVTVANESPGLQLPVICISNRSSYPGNKRNFTS